MTASAELAASGREKSAHSSAASRDAAVAAPIEVIGFDMGGTSTDVSRFAGTYEHIFENTIAGISIQAPQLDINTVAAGGAKFLLSNCAVVKTYNKFRWGVLIYLYLFLLLF